MDLFERSNSRNWNSLIQSKCKVWWIKYLDKWTSDGPVSKIGGPSPQNSAKYNPLNLDRQNEGQTVRQGDSIIYHPLVVWDAFSTIFPFSSFLLLTHLYSYIEIYAVNIKEITKSKGSCHQTYAKHTTRQEVPQVSPLSKVTTATKK